MKYTFCVQYHLQYQLYFPNGCSPILNFYFACIDVCQIVKVVVVFEHHNQRLLVKKKPERSWFDQSETS